MGHQGQVQKPREVPRPLLGGDPAQRGNLLRGVLEPFRPPSTGSSLLSAATGEGRLPELRSSDRAEAASGSCSPGGSSWYARPALNQEQTSFGPNPQPPHPPRAPGRSRAAAPGRPARAPSRRPAARAFDMRRPARRLPPDSCAAGRRRRRRTRRPRARSTLVEGGCGRRPSLDTISI